MISGRTDATRVRRAKHLVPASTHIDGPGRHQGSSTEIPASKYGSVLLGPTAAGEGLGLHEPSFLNSATTSINPTR